MRICSCTEGIFGRLRYSIKRRPPQPNYKDWVVDGNYLLAAGIPEGPEIGYILLELLDAVMDGRIENERQTLLDSVVHFK